MRFLFIIILLLFTNSQTLHAMFVKFDMLSLHKHPNLENSGSALSFSLGLYDFGYRDHYTVGLDIFVRSTINTASLTGGDLVDRYSWLESRIYSSIYSLAVDESTMQSPVIPLKEDLKVLENTSIFEGYFATFTYHILDKRGLYLTAGLGQGRTVFVRKGAKDYLDLVKNIDQIMNLEKDKKSSADTSKTEKEEEKEKNKEKYKEREKIKEEVTDSMFININNILKNYKDNISELSYMLNGLFNKNESLKALQSIDSLQALRKDRANIRSLVDKIYDADLKTSKNAVSSPVCSSFVDCADGMAYLLVIGYDYEIWQGLGLDIYAKTYGLFSYKPYYAFGLNLSFAW